MMTAKLNLTIKQYINIFELLKTLNPFNMTIKKTFTLILFFATLGCLAQAPVTVGTLNPDGTFTLTATNSELNSIFDQYTIMDNFDGAVFTITQDTVTSLYYIETTGIGIGPELGKFIAMRAGIGVNNGVFTWDVGFGLDAETCKGDPCSKCIFAARGRWDCSRNDGGTGGHCDHTITK